MAEPDFDVPGGPNAGDFGAPPGGFSGSGIGIGPNTLEVMQQNLPPDLQAGDQGGLTLTEAISLDKANAANFPEGTTAGIQAAMRAHDFPEGTTAGIQAAQQALQQENNPTLSGILNNPTLSGILQLVKNNLPHAIIPGAFALELVKGSGPTSLQGIGELVFGELGVDNDGNPDLDAEAMDGAGASAAYSPALPTSSSALTDVVDDALGNTALDQDEESALARWQKLRDLNPYQYSNVNPMQNNVLVPTGFPATFNTGGLASFSEEVKKLEDFGRNGDVYVAHVSPGDTVVPMGVLNKNPLAKNLLFGQIREMGLTPEEFIVGSNLTNVNPHTGLQEFFFSNVFRSVKNAVKKVAKVAKKAAPVVLPMAAAYMGFPFLGSAFGSGTVGASVMGSGIASLLSGKDFKSSVKDALLAGGTTALFSGAKGIYQSGPSGFTGGVKSAFTGMDPTGSIISGGDAEKLSKERWGDFGELLGLTSDTPATPDSFFTSDLSPVGAKNSPPSHFLVGDGTNLAKRTLNGPSTALTSTASSGPPPVTQRPLLAKELGEIGTAFDKVRGQRSEGVAGLLEKNFPSKITAADVANKIPSHLQHVSATELKEAVAGMQPGLLEQYGPSLALGSLAAKQAGLFDPEDVEQPTRGDLAGVTSGVTGAQLLEEDPSRYRIEDLNPYRYDYGNPLVETMYAAHGGMADTSNFPRRSLLVEGPGTERSDSIPAMLSDGEFVISAAGVRGADPSGKGDRSAGAQNLYRMMRNFEMRA